MLGKLKISAYWFKPILQHSKVIGTKIFYVNQADPGGSLPNWVKTTFAPKAVLELFESLVNVSKKG